MRALAMVAMLLWAGNVQAGERHYTPEGWYQLEPGYGETSASVIEIYASAAPAPEPAGQAPAPSRRGEPGERSRPEGAPPGQPGDGLTQDELASFLRVDCELVRGQYLARVFELHGVHPFWSDPRELAPWTYLRPAAAGSGLVFGFAIGLGDPALAILYGEPAIPPGSLSSDSVLRVLARDLLACPVPDLEPIPEERSAQPRAPSRRR